MGIESKFKISVGFAAGYWAAYTLGVIVPSFLVNEGRGNGVTECPKNYNPIVKVSSAGVLGELAVAARNNHIQDSFAHGSRKPDIATLPGELACKITGVDLSSQAYLLPAGLDALQRSSNLEPLSGKLPSGLEWVSVPGK